MSAPILATDALGVRYGSFVALQDVTLRIAENSVHSIIGPNGAGKTTLFHALTGRIAPSAGRITLAGRDITRTADHERVRLGLARSFQVTSLFPTLSVRENLRLAAQGKTNREVAAALFLSERTVESHLTRVYAKLGVRSRTELARTLQ